MDWRRLTVELDTASGLPPEAQAAHLSALTREDPALAAAVEGAIARRRTACGFMLTAADEAGPDGAPLLAPGERVGVWRIEGLIGAGGMGEVYRAARDDGLYEQTVALKVLKGDDPAWQARFEAERRRLARMDHPGISRIVDGGTTPAGRPFMVMEYVDGEPLDLHAERAGLDRRARLQGFAELCDALAHAHGKLILHRDIKPANALIDCAGKVRLIDFGISSLITPDGAETSGPLTLAYAAPEQLGRDALTVATDIFALGMVLHELVAGELPVRRSDGGVEIDEAALASADLAAICRKACASEPSARYPSAGALGEDVRAVLDHRPVIARAGGPGYRFGKLLRRFPVASTLAAAAAAAILAGLVASTLFALRAEREANEAREALARSEYFLDTAKRHTATLLAYGDAMQRLFGGEADVERQTQILFDYWQEAHSLRAEKPDNAARLSFAIGRHFLFRNDYETAEEILSAWVSEGYGDPDLLADGKQFLALVYMNTSRPAAAEPLIRETVARYAGSYEANSSNHAAAAVQLASITNASEDVAEAERIISKMLNGDHGLGDQTLAYFYSKLGQLRAGRGDFEGAYEATAQAVAVEEGNPISGAHGRDTRRLNLAEYELFLRRDPAAARALVRQALDEETGETNNRWNAGRAKTLLGLVALKEGDAPGARALLDEARRALADTGTGTSEYFGALMALAEAEAAAGDLASAETRLEEGRALVGPSADASPDYRTLRLRLAEARVRQRAPDLTSVDEAATRIAGDLELTDRYRDLAEAGLAAPLP